MKKPYERLPECGEHYTWAGEVKVCRRAEGHRGHHRVSREAWSDETRIRQRLLDT